jgi:hypothetical protein
MALQLDCRAAVPTPGRAAAGSEPSGVVQIIGAPVGTCGGEVKNTWRDVAAWAASKLAARFGETVRVEYFDLLDPTCPSLPADARLPLVVVNGEVVSSGGKMSIPAIRKRLEAIGLHPDQH